MIGTSTAEYIFIRLSIWLLRLVAPASILSLVASALAGRFLLGPWLTFLAVSEAAFYLCFYLPRRESLQKLNDAIVAEPPLTRSERQALFNRCATCLPDNKYPMGWFLAEDIKRDNIVEWLLWALFSTTFESAQLQEEWPEWNEELSGYVNCIEKLVHRKFEPGRNDKSPSMRIAFDRVLMCHRPLAWYAIVGIVDLHTAVSLIFLGFKHFTPNKWFRAFPFRPFTVFSHRATTDHFPYWYRPHTSTTKKPIVFIHGIGIGLYPYVALFRELISSEPDVGILLIEILPISMHITCDAVPSRPVMLDAIQSTLDAVGIAKAVIAGHSFGTVIASWVMRDWGKSQQAPVHTDSSEETPLLSQTNQPVSRDLASRFTSLLLIDPIPILLHLPDVAYNFLYRPPKRANEWQLWFFASRDPDVARTLGRYFFWRDCVLWKEDLLPGNEDDAHLNNKSVLWPGRVAVVLSGADQIVASDLVWRYLTGSSHTSDTDLPCAPPDSKIRRWTNLSLPTGDDAQGILTTGQSKLQVSFYPDLDHATIFDTKDRRQGLIDILEEFISL